LKGDRSSGKGRWKLWHFAVVVFLSALIFGTIRALARGADGAIDGVYFLVVIALTGLAPLALIRGGRKLAGPTTSALKDWGVRHGGAIGFLAWLVAILTEVGYYVASIVIGPVATIFLLIWLARQVGR
jgi:hypothetical protein